MRFLRQSKAKKYSKNTGQPNTTRLLQLCLRLKITLFPWSVFNINFFIGMMMFAPQNLNTRFFQEIFSSFFLLVVEHQTKLLAFTLQIASFLNASIKFLVMMFQGRLMQEALRVKMAVMFQSTSSYLSSIISPKPIAVISGNRPKPSSSGIGIQLMPLYPNLVYFAVKSPIVIVLLLPRYTVTVFQIACTQVNIYCRKEVQAVSSNLRERAPSERSFRLGEITIALTKFVLSKVTLSFSPQMNSPNMISSKKLLSLLESLTINDIFVDFYIYPRIIQEEPSIIVFSTYLFFSIFLSLLFYLELIFIFYTIVSVKRLHLRLVPSTIQFDPLIQLMGVVKSTDKVQCKPSFMKGIEQVISFSIHTSLYYAS